MLLLVQVSEFYDYVNQEKLIFIDQGNGRRLLSNLGFNHALVENQLLNLQHDINMDSGVSGRKIYKAKRYTTDSQVCIVYVLYFTIEYSKQ